MHIALGNIYMRIHTPFVEWCPYFLGQLICITGLLNICDPRIYLYVISFLVHEYSYVISHPSHVMAIIYLS